MNIPDYQSLMLPLLEALADGKEHALRDVRDAIAAKVGIAPAEREVLLPSGKQPVFDNRIGWAKTYLDKAGLVSSVRRGVYQLTQRGRAVMASKPSRVDVTYLAQFPEFEEFRRKGESESEEEAPSTTTSGAATSPMVGEAPASTPQESMDAAYSQLRRAVETELLVSVRAASFRFFERLVVELLVKMGYGGSPSRCFTRRRRENLGLEISATSC
jgi:restriction system protein